MPLLKPDPTFYPSPKMAMQAPPETLAYVALINPTKSGPADAIGVVDVDPNSKSYGRLVGQTDMPQRRRRAASLRLERVQLVPVSLRAAPAHGTALPDRAGDQLVAHSHPRHEARSAPAEDRQGDRAGDAWPAAPATPRRTRCTAVRTAST